MSSRELRAWVPKALAAFFAGVVFSLFMIATPTWVLLKGLQAGDGWYIFGSLVWIAIDGLIVMRIHYKSEPSRETKNRRD